MFYYDCEYGKEFTYPSFLQPATTTSPAKTGTLQTRSVTASQLATDSPAKMNGHYHDSPSENF